MPNKHLVADDENNPLRLGRELDSRTERNC